jgi:hypothetical protein
MPIDIDFLKSQLVDIENARNARQSQVDEYSEQEANIRKALAEAETQKTRNEDLVTDSGRASADKPAKTEPKK